VSIPFIGTFLDKFQTRTVLAILVSTATAIGVLGCIPGSVGAAYANIALFVLYRPFYYTAVSDDAAKVFGIRTVGKVYGLVICLAGVGNFAQARSDAVTLALFGGDPVPVHAVLTGLFVIVGVLLVVIVSWKTSVIRGERDRKMGVGVGGGRDGGDDTAELSGSRNQVVGQGVTVRDWEREPLLSYAAGECGTQGQRGYGS
jgi:hypothetical protein